MTKPQHQPVLLETVMALLDLTTGQSYLDLTAGYGGHAAVAQQAVGDESRLILVDRDPDAAAALAKRWPKARILRADFVSAAQQLIKEGIQTDALMLDLGVSSPQLDNPKRGFSFNHEGPLDMRMDPGQKLTAAAIVNHYREADIADLLYRLGEERRSRQIAKLIVRRRPFTTTTELADTITKAFRKRQRLHPATRSFQALRLAVNDELGQLTTVLPLLPELLKPGGRLAIISFHSGEDRLVKQWLKHQDQLTVLTKKVILGKSIDSFNPRARSAKLRAAIKK